MNPFKLSFVAINDDALEDYTSILTSTRSFDPKKQMLLGCLCNGKPCGLAAAELKNKQCAELVWIEVRGGLRRRKIGTEMLSVLCRCLKAHGAVQLTALWPDNFPAKTEMESFLLSAGFAPPVTTQMVFFAEFSNVLEHISDEDAELFPQMEGSLQSMASLSPKTETALNAAVSEARIPAFVLPKNAVGELLGDYSLVYTEAQSICAAVMYSELPALLYLDAVYLNYLHHKEGMRLVFYTLKKALTEYEKAEVLALDAINPKSLALVEHFTRKFPHHCETRRAMRKQL